MGLVLSSKKSDRFYCYALLRPDGTPFYVGKGFGKRFRAHAEAARRGERSHKANIIRKIIREGGEVGYMFFAENLTEMQANVKEVEMISTIGRKPNGPLVNLTDGGEGVSGLVRGPEWVAKIISIRRAKNNYAHTDATRQKISMNRKGKDLGHNRGGWKLSAETRAKMSASRTGMKRSAEAIAKTHAKRVANGSYIKSQEQCERIAAKLRGRKLSIETITKREATRKANDEKRGYHNSLETRAKMAEKARGRKLSPEIIAKRTTTRRARGGYGPNKPS
jgi:hypothetical protein